MREKIKPARTKADDRSETTAKKFLSTPSITFMAARRGGLAIAIVAVASVEADAKCESRSEIERSEEKRPNAARKKKGRKLHRKSPHGSRGSARVNTGKVSGTEEWSRRNRYRGWLASERASERQQDD